MLTLVSTNQFKKDLKRLKKQGKNLNKLKVILQKLINDENLEPSLRDHNLVGNYEGFRECHIAPDWLLIYKIDKNQIILIASRTASHSELF